MMNLKHLLLEIAHRFGYHVSAWPMRTARPDFKVTLRDFLVAHRINCVFDVGANVGQYAAMLRSLGYSGRIVSFEPDPTTFEILQRKVAGDAAWRVHCIALGNEPGEMSLHVSRSSDFSSLRQVNALGAELFPGMIDVVRHETVPVTCLADVLDECISGLASPSLFLKMDTQGFDREVLSGAVPVIERFHGVQTEVAVRPIYEGVPLMTEMVDLLHDLGFDLAAIAPVSRHVFSIVELDGLFQRRASQTLIATQAKLLASVLLDPQSAGIIPEA